VRVLHFADLHLGVENYGRLDPTTGLSSRAADFLGAFDRVVEFALDHEVDLVLFAGDAFKNVSPSPTYQRAFAERIYRLAVIGKIPVFLLAGNHDLPHAAGRAHTIEIFETLEVPRVTVAHRPGVTLIETASGPVQVVAVPWIVRSALLSRDEYKGRSLDEIDELLEDRLWRMVASGGSSLLAQLDPDLPTVLVAHGTVQGAVWGSERGILLGNDTVLPANLVSNPAFDYVALGHIHKHQAIGESPPVVYSGSLERIDFGEEKEPKGFVVVDLHRHNTSWRFEELPARRFVTVDVKADATDPTAAVLAAIARHDIQDAVVRVRINMSAEAEPLLDERAIRSALKPAFHVAAVAKNVERQPRLRLGDAEGIEELAPLDLLARYFEAKEVPAERTEVLLRHAGELIAEVHDRRG